MAGATASSVALDTTASSAASGKKGKAAVVLRVPAGSPMACAWRQALARREAAMRRAREVGREYELPTARGETLLTQCWWPHGSSSAIKPRAIVVVMHRLNEHSGRYDYLAKRLNDMDFKVYVMDWTGTKDVELSSKSHPG